MSRLYLDLDGVLGDFYGHCAQVLGPQYAHDQDNPKELFRLIREHGSFYETQPLLPDARELWEGCKAIHSEPIILTGIPWSVPGVAAQKRRWVDKYFGTSVRVISCYSAQKSTYCAPGDILVDDRLKYSGLWLSAGGVFMLHRSAQQTLIALVNLLTGPRNTHEIGQAVLPYPV